jgi:hypothetical protein
MNLCFVWLLQADPGSRSVAAIAGSNTGERMDVRLL